ncbi:MAG: cytochrome b/b6 domain-containing protein [Coriobacteriia bacterium]|nr:cytochrome b/b6 domain-containing protein [Coriobacteriia bacterium]
MSHEGHYREAHPLIFVFQHWVNLICMAGLAFSGFVIHGSFYAISMGGARMIHFTLMFVLAVNITSRIILSFWVKDANQLGTREVDTDIKNWLPQKENKHQLLETAKYYLFMRKERVISAKYGALQKIAYLATVPITFFMGYTGFALYGPAQQWPVWGFFAGGISLVGGIMTMRIIHYFGMWVVILFTMVHAYLAAIDGFKAFYGLIFLWRESPGAEEGH